MSNSIRARIAYAGTGHDPTSAHAAIDRANAKSLAGNRVKASEPRADITAPTAWLQCPADERHLMPMESGEMLECPACAQSYPADTFGVIVKRSRLDALNARPKAQNGRYLGTSRTVASYKQWIAAGCPPHEYFAPDAWREAAYDENNLRLPTARVQALASYYCVRHEQPKHLCACGRIVATHGLACDCAMCREWRTWQAHCTVEPSIAEVEPRYARGYEPARPAMQSVASRFPIGMRGTQ